MLRIEIRGFPVGDVHNPGDGLAVRKKVWEILGNMGREFSGTPRVEIVYSDIEDEDGKSQPYVRVLDHNTLQGWEIVLCLRLAGFAVEFKRADYYSAVPVYTMAEIEAELSWISKGEHARAVEKLRRGKPTFAINLFDAALAALPKQHHKPWPTDETLAQRVSRPANDDQSYPAQRARFIRWIQMYDIIGGPSKEPIPQ